MLIVGGTNYYYITANDATTLTVWGDATEGGAVSSPADYALVDYRLQNTSPAIDTGTYIDVPPTDFDGVARPQGAGFDMGAYERSAGSKGECEFQLLFDDEWPFISSDLGLKENIPHAPSGKYMSVGVWR